MPIRIEHGRPSTLLTAAQLAGQARKQEELQKIQMEFDYKQALFKQQMDIDLEMDSRARLWEVEKMEISSRIDFQREEQVRQRKLDSYDNIDSQLDKEVQSGRMTEKEAEPYKLKNDLARQGMNVSISDITRQQEGDEDRFGVRPYYLEPEFERDFPELAAAKKKEVISGQRRGTVPYYLDPEWLRANRDIAMQVLESKGVMLEEDEIDAMIRRARPTELPLGEKQLDVGVRVEPQTEQGEGRIRVISPEGQSGTILESERQDYINQGFTIVGEAPAFRGAGAQGTWEESPTETPTPKRKPRISWNRLMSKGFK